MTPTLPAAPASYKLSPDRYDSDAALMDKQNWGPHEVHYNASTAQLLRELAEV